MKTVLSYFIILLLSLPSFSGGAAILYSGESTDAEVPQFSHSSHSSHFSHGTAESSGTDCHQMVKEKQPESASHDCCEPQISGSIFYGMNNTICDHDDCYECSASGGSGFALLSSLATSFIASSGAIVFCGSRLPVSPFQNHFIPPIA